MNDFVNKMKLHGKLLARRGVSPIVRALGLWRLPQIDDKLAQLQLDIDMLHLEKPQAQASELARKLSVMGTKCLVLAATNSSNSADLSAFAGHFALCADLYVRHRIFNTAPLADDFIGDDCSFDYVKRRGLYEPGGDVDPPVGRPMAPWLDMFDDPECGIFLVLGQSNAGNHGDVPYSARQEVYSLNFMDMRCHRAEDPLPGASGCGGSVWSRMGDELISAGMFKRVLFVPLAFGGTFLRDWTPGGRLSHRLALALSRLSKCLGSSLIDFDAVLWQQGEAEANLTDMTAEQYRELFLLLVADLRNRGVFSPIFISQTSICDGAVSPRANHAAIRDGQASLHNPVLGLLAGPDTDTIIGDGRYDGCHLSGKGMALCARLWSDTLRNAKEFLITARRA